MGAKSMLKTLGYEKFFDEYMVANDAALEQIARVTAEHKGAYEVANGNGEYRATITGKLMLTATHRDDYPAVGDWVILNHDGDDEVRLIIDILPRKTTLHKKYGGKAETQLIAANVDVAFIVESIDRDFSLNRFERYVVLAREGSVKPVIILNKSDLSSESDVQTKIGQIRERFGDIDVLATSTVTATGLDMLSSYIQPSVTYCFLGSSGVGKSSLINTLLAQEHIATKTIGVKTGRGRHTTTSRAMYITESGGVIIDNPGSREVGVADASGGVAAVFVDIESLARACKFKDCTHQNEPGCAVCGALSSGTINAEQFENYQKLRKETEHYQQSAHEKRQKDKQFGKFIKTAKKDLHRYKP